MGRIFLWVLAVLMVSVSAMCEVVDAVYFNPSRLGRYEYLKVSDKLTANGGITATDMTVQTKPDNMITVNNTGSYSIYNITAAGKVQMPDTTFTTNSISALPSSRASFDKDSVIDNLLAAGSNVIKAKTLTTSGKIRVTASAQGKDLSGNSVTGLKIGNQIPAPTGCSNGLAFVERVAADGNRYSVLACKGEVSEPEKTCDDEDYFNEHKSTCCVGKPQSDLRCWKYKWVTLQTNNYAKCPSTMSGYSCDNGVSGNGLGYCTNSYLNVTCTVKNCIVNMSGWVRKQKCELVQNY